ncbi:MAG: Rieske (2Fe-2S) protein [Chitinophagaceae bacterium]
MDRKQFVKQCGFACLGATGVSIFIQSCTGTRQINSPIVNNQLQVPLTSFIASKGDKQVEYKRYIIARNEQLNYPLVVYRNAENDYTALLLRCSHQYNELNVNGELLSCPAHGSEFDNKGNIISGPADAPLRSFTVTTDNQNIYIQLA